MNTERDDQTVFSQKTSQDIPVPVSSLTCVLAAGAFVLLCVATNWLSSVLGQVPLGWGLAVSAGTFAAGLVLLVRDAVHEAGGLALVFVCIAAGGLLSFLAAGPGLAVASVAAFTVAEFADLAVYAPLRRRSWVRAALWSGVAGSVADTVLFLWLAPFPLTAGGVLGQVFVKVAVTVAAVGGVVMTRAVLRDSFDTISA